MAAWPWQSGGGGQPAQSQNYWSTNYAVNQQAQQAGMPQGSNYQSPTGYRTQAPSQQAAWSAPSQGGWQSQGQQQTAQPRSSQQPSGWGSYQAAPQQGQQAAAPQSWWQQGGSQPSFQGAAGGWQQPQQGGGGNGNFNTVMGFYQQYLGRTPSADEVNSWLANGQSLSVIQQGIANSDEARQRMQQQQQQQLLPPNWWQQQGGITGPGGSMGGGGGVPGSAPQAGMDFDGYAPPNFVAQPAGGAMPGWDGNKWNNPNHQSPKYVVGRILSHFAPRTDNMGAAMQAIQQAYPGARQVGAGDISVPGVGVIDILQSAGAGGKAWQWLSGDGGGGGQQAAGGAYGAPGNDYMSMYMQLLQSLQQPQQRSYAAPQAAAASPDLSQYTNQIQQLQTQLAEMRSQLQNKRGLNVTYF